MGHHRAIVLAGIDEVQRLVAGWTPGGRRSPSGCGSSSGCGSPDTAGASAATRASSDRATAGG
jgi:hypothetical protein